jgi:hypothetical protein
MLKVTHIEMRLTNAEYVPYMTSEEIVHMISALYSADISPLMNVR